MSESLPTSIDRLLEHRHFVRRLARRLVTDEAAAADVEQHTWIAAWQHERGRRGKLRPWLRAIARNFAYRAHRDRERRERREEASARPERVAATDEIAQRLELERDLADAVLDLPKPQRQIIGLHFYEELSLRESARRLGTSYTSAHRSLNRALEMLKEKLTDRRGERKHWTAVLVSLGFGRGEEVATLPATSLFGVGWMTTKTFGMAAGLAIALIGAATVILEAEPAAEIRRREALETNEFLEVSSTGPSRELLPSLEPAVERERSHSSQDGERSKAAPGGVRVSFTISEEERIFRLRALCLRVGDEGPLDEEALYRKAINQSQELEQDANSFHWLDLEPGTYQIALARHHRLAHWETVDVEGEVLEMEWKIPPLTVFDVVIVNSFGPDGAPLDDVRVGLHFESETWQGGQGGSTLRRGPGKHWLIPTYRAERVLAGRVAGIAWASVHHESLQSAMTRIPLPYEDVDVREVTVRYVQPVELIIQAANLPEGLEVKSIEVMVAGGGERPGELRLGGYERADEQGRATMRLQPGLYDVSAELTAGNLMRESERVQIRVDGPSTTAVVRFVSAYDVSVSFPKDETPTTIELQYASSGTRLSYSLGPWRSSFVFQGVPEGSYRILAEGYQPVKIDVPKQRRLRLEK